MKTKQSVIAVFDIGKTNKKLLLFNENYELVSEQSTGFPETVDDEGFPCEDPELLCSWILDNVQALKDSQTYQLKAVNFSTYGASLVYVDKAGNRIAPLYNYLKPYPEEILEKFLAERGMKGNVSVDTASPVMGNLNAGLQIYALKYLKPELFSKLDTVLHFPQYLSYRLTGERFAEMTNVGSHSLMWNFSSRSYHQWLTEEGIRPYLLPVENGDKAIEMEGSDHKKLFVGIGLHDSSAAIIPYLLSFNEPFVIVSTGTWTISLNPFNSNLPLKEDLENGGLSYQTYNGRPVKVSMLLAGHDHDQQTRRIATHFNLDPDYFKSLCYDPYWNQYLSRDEELNSKKTKSPTDPCCFHLRDQKKFQSADHAYHQLMLDIIERQSKVTRAVLCGNTVHNMYVDGGFSKNNIYMQLMANAFPEMNVFSSSMVQGTALGAALAIHSSWNKNPLPASLIKLKQWTRKSEALKGEKIY